MTERASSGCLVPGIVLSLVALMFVFLLIPSLKADYKEGEEIRRVYRAERDLWLKKCHDARGRSIDMGRQASVQSICVSGDGRIIGER